MKFNLGHWMIKPNIQPLYAVEYYESYRKGDELHILAPGSHVENRGGTLSPSLFVTLTSPREGIIGVTISHHKGQAKHDPRFELNCGKSSVQISETDDYIDYSSGPLTARVKKGGGNWGIEYIHSGKPLTSTGFRAMAHFTDTETGKKYVQEALELGVGECVYGLGERFTPFVRNGQVIDMWQGDGGSCSEMAYKNIPFYLTNRGYGVFVDTPGEVMYEVGSENVERVQFAVEDESLTYYIIAGPTPRLSALTLASGRY